jgi:hypothetical protein
MKKKVNQIPWTLGIKKVKSPKEERTIQDCIDCLYKFACIKLRDMEVDEALKSQAEEITYQIHIARQCVEFRGKLSCNQNKRCKNEWCMYKDKFIEAKK